jgi:hypothetical protein
MKPIASLAPAQALVWLDEIAFAAIPKSQGQTMAYMSLGASAPPSN